jgi:hypothetical protein
MKVEFGISVQAHCERLGQIVVEVPDGMTEDEAWELVEKKINLEEIDLDSFFPDGWEPMNGWEPYLLATSDLEDQEAHVDLVLPEKKGLKILKA